MGVHIYGGNVIFTDIQ